MPEPEPIPPSEGGLTPAEVVADTPAPLTPAEVAADMAAGNKEDMELAGFENPDGSLTPAGIAVEAEAPVSRIVSAVGTAVHSEVPGLSALLEAAMSKAVEAAQAEGIVDSAEIIARKMAAKDAVLHGLTGA